MRGILRRMSAMLLAASFALLLIPAQARGMEARDYWSKSTTFITSNKWKDGANWGSDCSAYARDFTSQVYGTYDWGSGEHYSNASEIRTGDVIHSNNHYFVVYERNGNTLYTAEGNATGLANRYKDGNNGPRCLVCDCHYYLSGQSVLICQDFFGGGNAGFVEGWHFDTGGATTRNNWDKTPPSYSGFKVSEINSDTFTVMAKVTDACGVGVVQCAVWSENNGQDDLVWYDMHCTDNNDIYWARVPWSEHNGERGTYNVHLYAYDMVGNKANPGLQYDFKNTDTSGPEVTDFRMDEFHEGGFTVMAKVKDGSGIKSIRYAIWTENGGQDDIKWQDGVCTDNNDIYWARVAFSDHNNERGKYIVHIYAYDNAEQLTNLGISHTFDSAGPQVTNVRVSDVSASGYTVTCTVNDPDGISRVKFPTWTLANEQDDLLDDWSTNSKTSGTKSGNTYTFRVNASEHNNETGMYCTHIYAWDVFGNQTRAIVPDVDVNDNSSTIDTEPPSFKSINVVELSDERLIVDIQVEDNVDRGADCLQFKGTDVFGEKHIINSLPIQSEALSDDTVRCTLDLSKLDESESATSGSRGYRCGGAKHSLSFNAKDKAGNSLYGSSCAEWRHVYFTYQTGERIRMDVGETLTSQDIFGQSLSGWQQIEIDANAFQVSGDNIKALEEGSHWLYFMNNMTGHVISALVTVGPEATDIATARVPAMSAQAYTGAEIMPSVTVIHGGNTLAVGKDYTLAYENNINAGDATVTITGTGVYQGTRTETFVIEPARISFADIADIPAQSYTGSAIKPSVAVTYRGRALIANKDYTLSYEDNVNAGEATVTITGTGNFTGTTTATFTIVKDDDPEDPTPSTSNNISEATIDAIANLTYTGKALTPSVTVHMNDKTLVEDVDYGLYYKNNTDAGTATVSIVGMGDYTGANSVTFKINKATPSIKVTNINVTFGKTANLGAKATSGVGKLSYKSSSTAIATIDANGKVKGVKVGSAKITVSCAESGNYTAVSKTVTVKVDKAANSLAAKIAKKSVTVKRSKVKSKKLKLASNVKISTKGQGKVSYKNVSTQKATKKFKVAAATGKVTVPKGTKKGKYTLKIAISAAGDTNHSSTTKVLTYKIVVK